MTTRNFLAIISGLTTGLTNTQDTPAGSYDVDSYLPLLVIEEAGLSFESTIDPVHNDPDVTAISIGILNSDSIYEEWHDKNGFRTILTSTISLSDGAGAQFTVRSTADLASSDYVWIGQEVIEVTKINATTLEIVTRAAYNSIKQYHLYSTDENPVYVFDSFYSLPKRFLSLYMNETLVFRGIIEPTERIEKGVVWLSVAPFMKILKNPIFANTQQNFEITGAGMWGILDHEYPSDFTIIDIYEKGYLRGSLQLYNPSIAYQSLYDMKCSLQDAVFAKGFWTYDGVDDDYLVDFSVNLQERDGKYTIVCLSSSADRDDWSIVMHISEYSMLRILGFRPGTHQFQYNDHVTYSEFSLEAESPAPTWGIVINPSGNSHYYGYCYCDSSDIAAGTLLRFTSEDGNWCILKIQENDAGFLTMMLKDRNYESPCVFTSLTSSCTIVRKITGNIREVIESICDDSDGTSPELYSRVDFDLDSFSILDTLGYATRTYYLDENDNIFDILQNELKLINAMLHVDAAGLISAISLENNIVAATELEFEQGFIPALERRPPLTRIEYQTNYNYAKKEYEKPYYTVQTRDKLLNSHVYPEKDEIQIRGLQISQSALANWLVSKASNRFLLFGGNLFEMNFRSPIQYEVGYMYIIDSPYIPSVINMCLITSRKYDIMTGYSYRSICFMRPHAGGWGPSAIVTSYSAVTGIGTVKDYTLFSTNTDTYYFNPSLYGVSEIDVHVQNASVAYSQIVSDVTTNTITFDTGISCPAVPFLVTLRGYAYKEIGMEKFAWICDETDRLMSTGDKGYSWDV